MKIRKSSTPLKEPFWKYKAFGIPKDQFIGYDAVQTECSYKNKYGYRAYPYVYQIESRKALERPYKTWARGKKTLIIIPIEDFEVIREKQNELVL